MVKKKEQIRKYTLEIEDVNGTDVYHADDYFISENNDILTVRVGKKSINFPTAGLLSWSVQENEKQNVVSLRKGEQKGPSGLCGRNRRSRKRDDHDNPEKGNANGKRGGPKKPLRDVSKNKKVKESSAIVPAKEAE